MRTSVIEIDPRELRLVDQNARYMRHETFLRLVENIKSDGELTQLPFCAPYGYYSTEDEIQKTPNGNVLWEVLSGNHRVRAAIAADLDVIKVQVTEEPLNRNQRRAIQLSHNAIAGEDDLAVLKVIYESIDDPGLRIYSGLDDRQLELLKDVSAASIAEANLSFQTITMAFLPDELEAAKLVWELVQKEAAGSIEVWINRWSDYDRYMEVLETASYSYAVRNTATCMMILLRVFSDHVSDLQEGWIGPDGSERDLSRRVPIETIMGTRMLKAKTATRLKRLKDGMVGRKEVPADSLWDMIDVLADAYERASE